VHRLIYISRSLVGSSANELDAIVRRSVVHNQANGVTGMLWSDGANFAQVLEGEHDAVAETMSRIRADPRHADIEVLVDRSIAQRMFGGWAMVLPGEGSETTDQTAFLVGFAASQHTDLARRLYEIVLASYE
jgi:hypothetical protein